jgi:hypothetical protein
MVAGEELLLLLTLVHKFNSPIAITEFIFPTYTRVRITKTLYPFLTPTLLASVPGPLLSVTTSPCSRRPPLHPAATSRRHQ